MSNSRSPIIKRISERSGVRAYISLLNTNSRLLQFWGVRDLELSQPVWVFLCGSQECLRLFVALQIAMTIQGHRRPWDLESAWNDARKTW